MVMTTPSRTAAPSAAPEPRYLRAPVPLHFPEAELVPETKAHLRQKALLFQILELAFRERAAIGCDQFVYWDPTDPRQCLAPDAFVRLGAPDDEFRTWKVWERGAPDVAIEILSSDDARDRDWDAKLERYRRLGVRELVAFDAECSPPSLRLWESVGGDLVERALEGLSAPSRCLPGTWVVVPDEVAGVLLRLSRDPEGKDLFPTPAEHERQVAERERQAAERERSQRVAAEARASEAEARIRELEAELRRREAR
jgi:Uma2 family endonuclease